MYDYLVVRYFIQQIRPICALFPFCFMGQTGKYLKENTFLGNFKSSVTTGLAGLPEVTTGSIF